MYISKVLEELKSQLGDSETTQILATLTTCYRPWGGRKRGGGGITRAQEIVLLVGGWITEQPQPIDEAV